MTWWEKIAVEEAGKELDAATLAVQNLSALNAYGLTVAAQADLSAQLRAAYARHAKALGAYYRASKHP